MKRKNSPKTITPHQAVQFLEDMRLMNARKDEPTQAISLRIPANVLRVLKTKAQYEGKKYQSLIVELIRQGLEKG